MSEPLHDGDEAPPPGVRVMAIVRWVLVVAMAGAAFVSLAAYFGTRVGKPTAPAAVQQIYHCPMHPQIVQDHPGTCPICSMALVPRSSAAAPAPQQPDGATQPTGVGALDLPLERVQRIGVRYAKVTRAALGDDLRATGVVAANERAEARITPRFSGYIEELFVAETGQTVKRGQVLATIFSPEVLEAQQELLAALGWSSGGTQLPAPHNASDMVAGMAADARHRLELLGIAAEEIDGVIARGKPVRAIPIRSPVAGHVVSKTAVLGMNVAAGTALFEVVDLATVWVVADLYEADAARARVGQPARFEAAAFPGEPWTNAKVAFIYPTLDAGARTLRVRLELRNRVVPGGGFALRPGMYGEAVLTLPGRTGLLVPTEAIIDTGDQQYVFVVKDKDMATARFEPRKVRTGARRAERVEVVAGLTDGETVVTTANFLIDSESRLRAAITTPSPVAPPDARDPHQGHTPGHTP